MRSSPVLLLLAALAFAFVPGPARAGGPSDEAAQPVDLQNATCPVTGEPAKPGVTATVNGAVVHFCCPKCIAEYRANPAAYEEALRSAPAVAQKLDDLAAAGAPMVMPASLVETDKGSLFHDAMRRLWEDHVTWTRLFVVSAIAGLPDLEATTNRLLRNQDDIGDGIKPYYGDEAGTKLTALLKDHIATAGDLVGALKAKDSAQAEAAKTKWAANADEIAAFLSAANPTEWPLEDAKSMMRAHLDATTAEVAARLAGDWAGDVAAYDKVHDQALEMADMLSDGIRRQFPAKFR